MQQLFIQHVPCASLMSMPRSPLSRVSPLHSCAVLRLPPPQWHQTMARSGRRVAIVTLRLGERPRTWCPCGGEEQKSGWNSSSKTLYETGWALASLTALAEGPSSIQMESGFVLRLCELPPWLTCRTLTVPGAEIKNIPHGAAVCWRLHLS